MFTCSEFYPELSVVIFKEVIHVNFSWFHLNSMLACFLLSQRIQAREIFGSNFTLVCYFHSRCCMFPSNVIIQVSLRGCWKVWTLSAISCSSWTTRLVSYIALLCSLCPKFNTCNFLVAVQSRHFWRNFITLSKQNTLKKYCFKHHDSSNARKIISVKL